jgi:hypothetical protein
MFSLNTDDKYLDTRRLLDFGFGQFEKITVESGEFTPFEAEDIRFGGKLDFTVLVHRDYLGEEIILSYSQPEENRLRISYYASGTPPNVPAFLGSQEIIGRPPPQSHAAMVFMPQEYRYSPAEQENPKIVIHPAFLWGAVILFAAIPLFVKKGASNDSAKHRNHTPRNAHRQAYALYQGSAAVGSPRDAPRQESGTLAPQNQDGKPRHNSNGWRHA